MSTSVTKVVAQTADKDTTNMFHAKQTCVLVFFSVCVTVSVIFALLIITIFILYCYSSNYHSLVVSAIVETDVTLCEE